MAKISLVASGTEFSLRTSDQGALALVRKLGEAFAEYGGAWIGRGWTRQLAEDQEGAPGGMLLWVPAGSADVDVSFDDRAVVDSLADLPGFIS